MVTKDEKPKAARPKIDVPVTSAQREAIVRAARKAALPPASWARMMILRETDWDPDTDPELTGD